jgi:hypothetical protein
VGNSRENLLQRRDGAGADVPSEHVEGLELCLRQVAAAVSATSRESDLDGLELFGSEEVRVLSLATVGLGLESGDRGRAEG